MTDEAQHLRDQHLQINPRETGWSPATCRPGARTSRSTSGDGPFISGAAIHVADLKLHMAVRWFNGGRVDHIPATIFDAVPKLTRLHDAVRDHRGVRAWYAKSS